MGECGGDTARTLPTSARSRSRGAGQFRLSLVSDSQLSRDHVPTAEHILYVIWINNRVNNGIDVRVIIKKQFFLKFNSKIIERNINDLKSANCSMNSGL